MPRLAHLVIIPALIATAAWATAAPPPPPADPVPTAGAGQRSVVLRIDGPSVMERLHGRLPVTAWAAAPRPESKLGRLAREAEAAALRAQAPVEAAVTRAGGRVVGRYVTAANGLLVHGTPEQLRALRSLAGVRAVEPAPHVRPALARTVPRVGAAALAARTGYDGAGTVIAVIDSGIDYTHAAFGGPGTAAAYAAAVADSESIDDEYEGRALFPNLKVVGGWDFVGPNYTSPDFCPPEAAAAGMCTSVPNPNPDPIDQAGHGTHVASAAAGLATAELGQGVAPGARLVALKIYGPPRNPADIDEAVDVVIDAIEWCVRVNLGLAVPGTVPPAGATIGVINLSLGEVYAQGSLLFDEAIDAAVGAGMVVAAAAGNGQNRPFVVTAPGTSPRALSVASLALGASPADDGLAGHSGRGPSRHGALKPDLAAPGSGIVSARVGAGEGGGPSSGTSLATPHVSGAAALLAQRARAEGLALSALDLGALLVNYALPLRPGVGLDAPGPARQGAGRLAVDRSGAAALLVRAGDIASIHLGVMSLAHEETVVRRLTVRNLGDDELSVRLGARMLDTGPAAALTVTVPGRPVTVPGGGSAEADVAFAIAPERLPEWSFGDGTISAADLDRIETGGFVQLTVVDEDGAPVDAEPVAGVPFYLVARRAAAVEVLPAGDGSAAVRLVNRAARAGRAELFVLPDGGRAPDPNEPDVLGELDLRHVGVRFEPAGEGSEAALAFGVALHEPASVPWMTVLELYLDLDLDGRPDARIRSGPASAMTGGAQERVVITVAGWDDAAGAEVGEARVVGTRGVDLHARTFVVRVPLSALGQWQPFAFDFYALHRGVGEDWLISPRTDLLPDGALGPCPGVVLQVRPEAWGGLPEAWSVVVPGGDEVVLPRPPAAAGRRAPALLALLPDNRFEPPDAQATAILYGARPEPPWRGGCLAFLPLTARQHVMKRSEADELFQSGLRAIAGQEYLKMEHTLSDPVQERHDARRSYRFRSPDGMRYTLAYARADEYWDFIRVGNEVFKMRHREGLTGDWHCAPVDDWTLFWPEFTARFERQFPRYGWRVADRATPGHPDSWLLRMEAADATYHARVHLPTGLLTLLSRRQADGRLDVYVLMDFGERNIGLGRPRVVLCP